MIKADWWFFIYVMVCRIKALNKMKLEGGINEWIG